MSAEDRLQGFPKDEFVQEVQKFLGSKDAFKATDIIPYLNHIMQKNDKACCDATIAEDDCTKHLQTIRVKEQTIDAYRREIEALEKKIEALCFGVTNAVLVAFSKGTSPERLARLVAEKGPDVEKANIEAAMMRSDTLKNLASPNKIVQFPGGQKND